MHNEGGADTHGSVDFRKGPLGRHRGVRVVGVVLVLALMVVLVGAIAGCGSGGTDQSASPAATGAIKMGGVLKIGSPPGNVNFDPVLFAGAVPDILLQAQIYEKLVTLGQDFTVQPTLATELGLSRRQDVGLLAPEGREVQQRRSRSRPRTSSTRWTACAARSSARRWPRRLLQHQERRGH